MDLTKNYIKMIDWSEIQDGWKPVEADIYYLRHYDSPSGHKTSKDPIGYWSETDPIPSHWHVVWLPRQDQSQKIVQREGKTAVDTLKRFWEWINEKCIYNHVLTGPEWIYPTISPDSFEQLWMAFLFHELYQKWWDGSVWRGV